MDTRSRLLQTLLSALAVTAFLSTTVAAAEEKSKLPEKVTYDDHIRPIFRAKCFACHSTDKKEASLDLSNYTNLLQGGASGEVIDPGSAADSYLWMLVNHELEPFMPPKSEKLPADMLALIEKWIDDGALENSGSKAMVKKKTFDFALSGASTGRPEGPVAMPEALNIDPLVHTERPNAVTAVATSPWAPLVALAGQKQVLLYDSQTLRLLGVLPYPEGLAHVLKFSRNGELLLAGGGHAGASGEVIVWNVRTGERVFEIGDELDVVLGADISSDNSLIALGGPRKVVRVYSTQTGELVYELRKHTDWITSLEFSPDGVLLATGDRNGGLFVWESFTGRLYATLDGHTARVSDVSWRSDSNILASGSEDASVKLWEMENGKNVKSWNAHGGGTASVEFARDGRVVTCGRDRVTKVWDQTGKQLVACPALPDLALAVTICDETNRVVAGDYTGAVQVWNAADAAVIGTLTTNPVELDERLAAAEDELTQRQSAFTAAQEQAAATLAALNTTKADLAEAQQAAEAAKTLAAESNETIQAAQKAAETAQSQLTAATNNATTLAAALPLLQEAHTKATQALAKVGEDAELKTTVEQLKAQFEQRTQQHAQATEAAKAAQSALAAAQKQLSDAQEQLKTAEAEHKTQAARAAKLAESLKDVEQKHAAALTAQTDAEAVFKSAQQQVADLKLHIELKHVQTAFREQNEKVQTLQVTMQDEQAHLEAAQAKVTDAQAAVADTQKQLQAAAEQVQASQSAVAAAQQAHQKTVAQINGLNGLLPELKKAVEQAEAARETAAEDTELAKAVQQLRGIFEQRTAQVPELEKTAAAQQQAIQQAQTQAASAQKAHQTMEAALAEAKKQLGEFQSAVPPLQERVAEAQAAAEAATARLQTIQASLDQVKSQIVSITAATDARAAAN